AEPAFTPLLTAVQQQQPVHFGYRRSDSPDNQVRKVEPWGVVSWRAHWYVVGHDCDRKAPRCFRLSRITGPVRVTDRPGSVSRPADVDLLALVRGSDDRSREEISMAI